MKNKEYKNTWQELKEHVISQYIILVNTEENAKNIETLAGRIVELKRVGLYMDSLDETQEFSNMLVDIERNK